MSDFLDQAIFEVLPDLPAVTKQLQAIGVKTYDDPRFIKDEDLTALRPVQARRLLSFWKQKYQTPENSSSSVEVSPARSLSFLSVSPQSSSSTSSSSSGITTQCGDFEIPWQKFPDDLVQCLERGKRLDPKLRRKMIRIVVTEMMEKGPRIGKKQAVDVVKYPNSLKDIIEGNVVGTGYYSLVKQLQNRIKNVQRSSTPKIRKRKRQADDSDHTDEIPIEETASMQDTYGCIKWNVKCMPLEETKESQQQKIEKLKTMKNSSNVNPEEVKCLMKSTYYTQRLHVNQGKSIRHLCDEWPFLFNELGMSIHYKELTGLDLQETFTRNLDLKGKRLLNYMTCLCEKKGQIPPRICKASEAARTTDVKEMILLLLNYFDEKEESMFNYVDDTCLAEEVQLEQLPLTPAVVVCGQSCYSATRYMLSVDREITNGTISSFISALCLMFGSFYCFNIHYPSGLGSTLEFLQRCFFSINPEKGTKVENNKRHLNMNPRVLALIQELSDHEWR
ncbi:unnamed protein product [Knipowitschia caucasica]